MRHTPWRAQLNRVLGCDLAAVAFDLA